ncbi:MAG: hypothetical protein R6V77_01240 [Candidatus Cloacimonadaceae bacterium]
MQKLLLLLLLISVLLCSCSLFKEPVFERLNKVELKDINPDYTRVDLSIVIKNPNRYGITVKTLNVDITDTTSVKLGNVVMTQPLRIQKNSSDTVYFEIIMETRKVTKLLSYSAPKVEFLVKANALANVYGISKRIKIQQRQSINFTEILEQMLPSIPSDIEIPTVIADKKRRVVVQNPSKPSSSIQADIFKVMNTTITDVGIKETELTIKFIMLNAYGLSFTFKDFPAQVLINDVLAGTGKLAKPIEFTEKIFQAEGRLVFTLNNFNTILLASRAVMKKDLDYRVNGTLIAEGFGTSISKPFTFKGTVEIGRKDK